MLYTCDFEPLGESKMFQTYDFETFDIKIFLKSYFLYLMDLSVHDADVRDLLLGMSGPIYKLWSGPIIRKILPGSGTYKDFFILLGDFL